VNYHKILYNFKRQSSYPETYIAYRKNMIEASYLQHSVSNKSSYTLNKIPAIPLWVLDTWWHNYCSIQL